MLVVSSMTSSEASRRGSGRRGSTSVRRTAYRVLRSPSSHAEASPVAGAPPAAATAAKANCDPPVNPTADSTTACSGDSPDATATAPKLTP